MTRGFIRYGTYSFVDKDPIIDEMRTHFQDSKHSKAWVAAVSGVSSGTISNWFGGKTRRPQVASTSAFMAAIGFERRWVRSNELLVKADALAARKKLNGKKHK